MGGMMSGWDWSAIYLTCFGIGLVLTLATFFLGGLHLHVGHVHLGGHGAAKGLRGGVSPVNGFTVMAFLCWFGGTGYLLHRGSVFGVVAVLLLSVLSGLSGAALVFWFLVGVLMPGERTLEASDTEMTGVIGTLSGAIPRGGVGEMLYSQMGARRAVAVRSDGGDAIERGAEVVVMRYERGVAYVRRWDEFEHGLLVDGPGRARDLEREGKG
jgi:hypothetical protein